MGGLYAVRLPHQFNSLFKTMNFPSFELEFGRVIEEGSGIILQKFERKWCWYKEVIEEGVRWYGHDSR